MVIRDYPNQILKVFLICHPIFDWMTMTGNNPELLGQHLSDIYLFAMLCLTGLYFVGRGTRLLFGEPFVVLGLVFLGYRVALDSVYNVQAFLAYGPRSILNVAIFALATQARTRRVNWGALVIWNLLLTLAYSLPAIQQSLFGNARLQAFYLNPNFLAFNAFHMGILALLFQRPGPGRRVAGLLALAFIVLSRTRSVMFSSFWFIGQFVRRRRNLALALAAVVIGVVYGRDFLRLSHDPSVQSLNGRVQIWRTMAQHLKDINYWTGGGYGVDARLEIMPAWDAVTGRIIGFTKPQNHYLLLLVENGVVGLVLWWSRILLYLRQLRRLPRDRTNQLVFCYVGSLLTIQLLENEIFVNPLAVMIMGLALAHGREKARDARAERVLEAEATAEEEREPEQGKELACV